jgi:hypothetical protein
MNQTEREVLQRWFREWRLKAFGPNPGPMYGGITKEREQEMIENVTVDEFYRQWKRVNK